MKFLSRLMPNCHEVCQLSSQSLESPLPPGTRFRLWMHFKMCRVCELYSTQLKQLHESLARHGEHFVAEDERLSPEARERIREQMKLESGG